MQERHLEPKTAKTRTEEKELAELGDGEPSPILYSTDTGHTFPPNPPKVKITFGEPSPTPKSFIDRRREFADQEWIPSCYMDDGRGGLLLENNTIVLGVGAGFNYEAVKKMATEHNAKIRSGAAQEVSPPSPEPCKHERLDADGTCKCGWSVVTRSWEAPYSPERELPRAEDSRKAQRKYAEGDTRELKAALTRGISAIREFWQESSFAERGGIPFIPSKGLNERCRQFVTGAEKLLG